MVLLNKYEKPSNCYDCPGFNKERYYCKFDSSIDFDKYPLDPVPPTCPMIDISPKQLEYSEWLSAFNDKNSFICSYCTTSFSKKTYYCPHCGSFMINGEMEK